MSPIKISIILPVYNSAATLEKSLDSALGQTLRELEVIAVDDGSADKSLRLLKQRAAARLEVGDSGSGGFFDHRQEVLGKYPRPEYRLETVPERRHHEIYFFHTALSYIIISGTAQYLSLIHI